MDSGQLRTVTIEDSLKRNKNTPRSWEMVKIILEYPSGYDSGPPDMYTLAGRGLLLYSFQ